MWRWSVPAFETAISIQRPSAQPGVDQRAYGLHVARSQMVRMPELAKSTIASLIREGAQDPLHVAPSASRSVCRVRPRGSASHIQDAHLRYSNWVSTSVTLRNSSTCLHASPPQIRAVPHQNSFNRSCALLGLSSSFPGTE